LSDTERFAQLAERKAAGEVLRPSRPLTGPAAPALGLRAGKVAVAILVQTAWFKESIS
jgi:hypothetical protein